MVGSIFSSKNCKTPEPPWTTATYSFTIYTDGSVSPPQQTQCETPNNTCPAACANHAIGAGIIDGSIHFIANPCAG